MPELGLFTPSARGAAFEMRPASARTVLRLKTWQSGRTGVAPLVVAGCELPDLVGSVSQASSRVLCTGPGEWLLVSAPTAAAQLRNVWAAELTTHNLALVDLTDGLAVFEVSGSRVREVLAKSCGLDVDPRRFAAGHCARTRFAQIPVVIDCIQDAGRFELYVPRSYAPYLKNWLLDAAVEFGDSLA
jgi:sarcosine oxidase subunit gamma